ncbi:MAG TPA: S16 family serine protease [Acidimicrobiales bacterium]|nr:S16 family serine protease [Acidimicrobiales bacterium]
MTTVVSLIAAVIGGALLIHVPYVIESPGNLYTTGDRISISGATAYPTNDKIDLVTVSVDTRVSALEKFFADHNGDDVVVPAKDVLGTQTPAQNDQLNQLLMSQSKDAAVLVALRKLGYNVKPTPTGAVVEDIVTGSPADGVLRVAETITAVDSTPITTTDDVHNSFTTHKPGDTVTLTLEGTDHTKRTVSVKLGPNPDSKGTAFLGVSLTTRLVYPDLPVKVTVASGQIGGPSAGLAFTLGILDLMTPGDLTAGKEIAVTGTIDAAGTVGAIGGIKGKVITVARQHVKYFLVPVENADEAKADAPNGLQIVPVHTVDDALKFLAGLGGSGLPPAPSPPGR